jgi:DNA-binding MarR family transcriptional regulator
MDDVPADIDLEFELTRLAQRLRRRSLQTVESLHPELDYGTYLYFLAIADSPGEVRGADLADQLGVHKSTASRAVSTLVRLGLVEQHPDPADGRARLLVPTEAAMTTLRAMRTEVHERLGRMLAGWDSTDVRALTVLLHRYNDSAEVL